MQVAELSLNHSLLLVYKVLSTKSPMYLYTKLQGVQEAKHYEKRFVLNRKRNLSFVLDIAKKSFKDRATSLPVNIREEQTLKKFKVKTLGAKEYPYQVITLSETKQSYKVLCYIVKKVFCRILNM